MAVAIEAFGRSDRGCTREKNEDDFLCLDLTAAGESADFAWLLAVADGIGGHTGGAQASTIAVQTLEQEFAGPSGRNAAPREILERVFEKANGRIFEAASRMEDASGMGTTLVAALIGSGDAWVANVGDSRAYLLRRGRLLQITQDQSWASEQRRKKTMSEKDIRSSPFRTMVTRSLGFAKQVEVDVFPIKLETGDALLLCSDGLYGALPEKKLRRLLKKSAPLKDTSAELLRLANKKGGPDNITAVLARLHPENAVRRGAAADTVVLRSERPPKEGR